MKTIQNGWSRNILQEQIESDLYRRQDQALTNFDLTLPDSQADLAKETLKNPYNFEFLTPAEGAKELDLERGLIQHMTNFLLELGKGFAYMGNQYNINVDGDDFFLDLLFFNTNLNRYVIFELKVGDFKPEYAGKLNMYVNTVNNQVKKDFHEETVGVLLCKTPNKTVIEYSITGIKPPLGVSNYTIKKALPKEFNKAMPSIQELEEELATEIKIQKNPLEQKREKLLELINARNNPELKIQKSFILIKKIINTVFIKLISKIDDKIDDLEIKEWYMSQHKTYTCNSQEFQDLDKFNHSLIETSIPRSINYNVSFNDFKKAGINTFGNELRLIMRFSTNTYSISFNHGIIEELLYSQILSEDKLVKLGDSIVNKLMDDIQKNVESTN